jgi:hypothetical protein
VGRFLSVDPLTKQYPWYTPYQYAGNKPVWKRDRDGLEEEDEDAKVEEKEELLREEEHREHLEELRNALSTPTPEEEAKRYRDFEDWLKKSPEERGRLNEEALKSGRLIQNLNRYVQNGFNAAEDIYGSKDINAAMRQFNVRQQQLEINKANSQAFEKAITTQLKNENSGQVVRQVTLLVTGQLNGQNVSVRIRVDNIASNNGILNLYEAKYSVEQITGANFTKTLTPNQQTAFEIFASGTNVNITIRGNNATGLNLPSGTNITGKLGDIKVVTNSTNDPASQPKTVKKINLQTSSLQNKQQ